MRVKGIIFLFFVAIFNSACSMNLGNLGNLGNLEDNLENFPDSFSGVFENLSCQNIDSSFENSGSCVENNFLQEGGFLLDQDDGFFNMQINNCIFMNGILVEDILQNEGFVGGSFDDVTGNIGLEGNSNIIQGQESKEIVKFGGLLRKLQEGLNLENGSNKTLYKSMLLKVLIKLGKPGEILLKVSGPKKYTEFFLHLGLAELSDNINESRGWTCNYCKNKKNFISAWRCITDHFYYTHGIQVKQGTGCLELVKVRDEFKIKGSFVALLKKNKFIKKRDKDGKFECLCQGCKDVFNSLKNIRRHYNKDHSDVDIIKHWSEQGEKDCEESKDVKEKRRKLD